MLYQIPVRTLAGQLTNVDVASRQNKMFTKLKMTWIRKLPTSGVNILGLILHLSEGAL